MKIVINNCFGGFGLSHRAIIRYAELKGIKLYSWADESTIRIYGIDKINELIKKRAIIHYTTVSKEAYYKLKKEDEKLGNWEKSSNTYFFECNIERTDKFLIQIIEELGKEANGQCAKLNIVEIPDNINWHIEEYDGNEHIAEDHKTWC